MAVLDHLSSLREILSEDSEVLVDPVSPDFQERLKRWTDIDWKEPAAIILPSSEGECLKAAQWAIKASIPFVTKSGGHSEWSTIDKAGVIIDLGRYKSIEVDVAKRTATLRGSILSKEVAVALADAGLFTGGVYPDRKRRIACNGKLICIDDVALGNGNTVSAIPYFLNGGASITTSITGFGADQILAARLITASGAGQFFGLVTELTVKAYPLSALGNDQGVIWSGSFVFPLGRAGEVASVMKDLMDNSHYATAGLLMVMALPPTRQPSLVVAARYAGNARDAAAAFQPFYDLNPLVAPGGEVLASELYAMVHGFDSRHFGRVDDNATTTS